MTRVAFASDRVFALDGSGEKPGAVVSEAGRIVDVVERGALAADVPVVELGEQVLAPGFVDVQVNGGGGALLNDTPDRATVRTIAAAHRRFGTTSLLPTFITDSLGKMRAARAAVRESIEAGEPGVVGIHFEGPFLDERKTGAHDRSFVRGPSTGDLAVMADGSPGVTLVTGAAKWWGGGELRTLLDAGVLVSLGHCASTYDEAAAAFARGVTGVTHLFNAMSPLESRAPGLVGAALATDGVRCGIILDGIHVAWGAAKAALRALGADRTMLVTDAVHPVGTDLTEFSLGGMRVVLEDGRCVNEEGALAGSALDMASAVRNAVRELDVALEDALVMASRTPARFLGLEAEIGGFRAGARADLVVLDDDLRCTATVQGGVHEPVSRT